MKKYQLGIAEWCVPVAGPACLRMAAEAGLDGVELVFGNYERNLPLTDARVRRYYLEAQQKYGMAFAGLAVNALDESFAMPPENERRAEERRFVLAAAVDTAYALGISILQVPNFWGNAIKNHDELVMTAGFLREACERAEKHGIIVSTENPLSVSENLELIDLVERPNFRLYFDTENPVYFTKTPTPDMLRIFADRICQIHVKDGTDEQMSCVPLGTGHAYFDECAEAIREIGYEGWIVLENDYDKPPFNTFENDRFELLCEDVRTLKRAFPQD